MAKGKQSSNDSGQSNAEPFTEQELKAFAVKLQTWGDALPEKERELLAAILREASEADEEVSGYFFNMGWTAFAGPNAAKVQETVSQVLKKKEEAAASAAQNVRG